MNSALRTVQLIKQHPEGLIVPVCMFCNVIRPTTISGYRYRVIDIYTESVRC